MKRNNTISHNLPQNELSNERSEKTKKIIKWNYQNENKEREENKELIEFVLGDFHDFHRIDDLQYFTKMTSLSITNDMIEDMGPIIENIPNKDILIYLCLNENYIKKIKCIEYLSNLKKLHLNFNLIEKIDFGISKVITLKQFWICDNKIKKIENLPEHINNFWIANNYIENLPSDFHKYKNIENLNLSGNCLVDFKNIYILEKLPNLKILYLNNINYGENPICSFLNYKMMMIHIFKNIQILDQFKINFEEKQEIESNYIKKTIYYKNKIRNNKLLIKNIHKLLKGHKLFYKGIIYNHLRLLSLKEKINEYKINEKEELEEEKRINNKNIDYQKERKELKEKIINNLKEIEILEKKTNKIKQHISDLNDLSIVINFYEIESYGNYKIEPGNLDLKWVKSCLDLLKLKISTEFLEKNKFNINFNRVFKIHNKKTKLIFESLYDNLIDLNNKFGSDKKYFDFYFLIFPKEKLSYRKVFRYLFEKQENEKEKILTDNITYIDQLYLNNDNNNKNFVAIICKCITFKSMIEDYESNKNFNSVNEIIKEIKSLKNKNNITKLFLSNENANFFHYKIEGAIEPFYIVEYEYIEKENNKDIIISSFNNDICLSYDHQYNFGVCCQELCSNNYKQFFSKDIINKFFLNQFNDFEELDNDLIFFAKNTIFNYLLQTFKYNSLKEFKDDIDKINNEINAIIISNNRKNIKNNYFSIIKEKMKDIKTLNLFNSELTNSDLEDFLNKFFELTEMDKKYLLFMKSIEKINLSNNNLEYLNLGYICDLFSNLKEIDISHNNIKKIKYEPNKIQNNVISIDISFNNINDFSNIILILKHFHSLNILKYIPNPFEKYCEKVFCNTFKFNITKEIKSNMINEYDKYYKIKNSVNNPITIKPNLTYNKINSEILNFIYIYDLYSYGDKYRNFSDNPYFREKLYQDPSLKTENLSKKKLLSIPNLQGGGDTEVLILTLNKISKINNLSQFPILTELYLQYNKISKIENLPKILKKLDISNNQLKSLEDLTKCINLEWLNVENNFIEKLDEITYLTKLNEFYGSGNKIINIKECFKLSKLKKLEILDLYDNDVCYKNNDLRINMINNIPNLKIFNRILIDKDEKYKSKDFFEGKLTNHILEKRIGSGNNTKNILELDLSNLSLKDQICLFSKELYTKLRKLNLSKNCFKSFNIFGFLPNLKELNLDYNLFIEVISKRDKIINGRGIMGLPNIEKLEMSNNQLINLNGIQYLKNLKTLILRENNFSKIESLNNMNNLIYLDVSLNKIENVDKVFLGDLPLLQIFICDDNYIKNINGLTKFESIKTISIQNNKIIDVNCLDRLFSLRKLKELFIKGNPITKNNLYRENLIKLIPSLNKIDNRIILEEERENSKINEKKVNLNLRNFNQILTTNKMNRRSNHNSFGESAKNLFSLPQIKLGKPIFNPNKRIFNGFNNTQHTFKKLTQRFPTNIQLKINNEKK